MFRATLLVIMGAIVLSTFGMIFESGAAQADDISSANLIKNGGFEEGKDPGPFTAIGIGLSDISQWEITKGTVDYIGGYFDCHSGKRCLDMDGTPGPGAIQQTFQTNPGARYRVTFAMEANRQGPPPVKKLKVSAAEQSKVFSFNVNKDKTWKMVQWEFTAKTDKTTLSFTSLSKKGNLCGALMDDVSVNLVEKVKPAKK